MAKSHTTKFKKCCGVHWIDSSDKWTCNHTLVPKLILSHCTCDFALSVSTESFANVGEEGNGMESVSFWISANRPFGVTIHLSLDCVQDQ